MLTKFDEILRSEFQAAFDKDEVAEYVLSILAALTTALVVINDEKVTNQIVKNLKPSVSTARAKLDDAYRRGAHFDA